MMWHGGGTLHKAGSGDAAWINHPMIGREDHEGPKFGGVADFVLALGPVAIFRITRDAGAFFQKTADIGPQDLSGSDDCRGWMENFNVLQEAASLGDVVSTVVAHGIEHHFVVASGMHTDVLAEFAFWVGMIPLARRPYRNHLDAFDYA